MRRGRSRRCRSTWSSQTLAEGFTKAQAEYDCPIMVTPKEINHYFYVGFHPVPDEAGVTRTG